MNNYDVVIIGGGIAGVTAAIYLKRANKSVVLLELSVIGGQIINASSVENYPGYNEIKGFELGNKFKEQLDNLSIEVKYEAVKQISGDDNNFTIVTNTDSYNAKKVIIATGTISRKLDIPDEDKYLGKGLSFCATCDGAFFKGKDVIVIGGGNAAIDDALYLSNMCNKVYLMHRRDAFRAEEMKVESLRNKSNVEFILNASIKDIHGSEFVENIDYQQNNEIKNLSVQGVFVCIGRVPSFNFDEGIELENGFIITNENMETNIEGIYAIGDIRKKEVRQLTTAASDGTIASMDIIKKL